MAEWCIKLKLCVPPSEEAPVAANPSAGDKAPSLGVMRHICAISACSAGNLPRILRQISKDLSPVAESARCQHQYQSFKAVAGRYMLSTHLESVSNERNIGTKQYKTWHRTINLIVFVSGLVNTSSNHKKKTHGLSPRANYTDRETAAGRRS
jgi:hypothetical protein